MCPRWCVYVYVGIFKAFSPLSHSHSSLLSRSLSLSRVHLYVNIHRTSYSTMDHSPFSRAPVCGYVSSLLQPLPPRHRMSISTSAYFTSTKILLATALVECRLRWREGRVSAVVPSRGKSWRLSVVNPVVDIRLMWLYTARKCHKLWFNLR